MWSRRLITTLVILATVSASAEAAGFGVLLKTLAKGASNVWGAVVETGSPRLPGKIPTPTVDESPVTAGPLAQPTVPDQRPEMLGAQRVTSPTEGAPVAQPEPSDQKRRSLNLTPSNQRRASHIPNESDGVVVVQSRSLTIRKIDVRQALVIGRPADINTLVEAGIIGSFMPTKKTSSHLGDLQRVPEGRVVVIANSAQAQELFDRLQSPQVQPRVLPYAKGRATLSTICDLCVPTAAIGYGNGGVSFVAGCQDGVTIEVSAAGEVKTSLSRGPYSVAVGTATDTAQQHTHTTVNSPAGVSASASAECRHETISTKVRVSATAVELKIAVHSREVAVNNVREDPVTPVRSVDTNDEELDETIELDVEDERGTTAKRDPASPKPALMIVDTTTNAVSSLDVVLAEWVCAVNANRRGVPTTVIGFSQSSCALD